jgi:tetratricopeptide (TPR) repeat protein
LEIARARAEEAMAAAARESDALPAIDAALGRAEVELRTGNLDAAVRAYNEALKLAQEGETPLQEALASLGLARVLLRRGLYEEAAIGHTEQLPRLRAADDVAALALAHMGIGAARRGLGDADAARQSYAEALRLYAAGEDVLGQAAALEEEGRVLAETPELEAAVGRFQQALALYERVAQGIADAGERASFFDGRAALYADAMLAAAREQNAARALELARSYAERADRAGRAAASQRLRELEQAVPLRGAELTKEQIERNKAIARILADARKAIAP